MKHNFMTKMVSALLAVVLSTAAFSVTAFASGGEETTESMAEQETAGDVSDLLSALAGSQVTVSVTDDGIQFSSGENDPGQTGTVTTGGGNLNVRTGAEMDYTAFTQLPNGTTVKVIGTDGDWLKVILPEKVGYVYSGYMTVSDGEAGSGEGPFSLDAETLENLLGMLGGGLNGGAALTPDGMNRALQQVGGGYILCSLSRDGTQLTYSPSMGMTMKECLALLEQAKELAAEAAGALNDGTMTEREQAEALYRYLTEHVKYDRRYYSDRASMPYHSQTAIGALRDQVAICGGYSHALDLLFEQAGIPCYTVTGTSGGENHMWNIARLDGQWLWFDATADRGISPQFELRHFAREELDAQYSWDPMQLDQLLDAPRT